MKNQGFRLSVASVFQKQDIASAKALKQEWTRYIHGTRKPMWDPRDLFKVSLSCESVSFGRIGLSWTWPHPLRLMHVGTQETFKKIFFSDWIPRSMMYIDLTLISIFNSMNFNSAHFSQDFFGSCNSGKDGCNSMIWRVQDCLHFPKPQWTHLLKGKICLASLWGD